MLTRARLREKVKPATRRLRGIAQMYRLATLYLLAHEPLEVRQITDHLGIKENLVAHHLKQLVKTGWIVREKQGRRVTYRLINKNFSEFFRLFEDTPFEREMKEFIR
jgi:DNA-binding HxlR family transcriptional regulator